MSSEQIFSYIQGAIMVVIVW